MKLKPQTVLLSFRQDLYETFPKRAAVIMDLIDAISADAYRYNSPTELSESRYFRRKYASVTRAISAFTSAEWTLIVKLMRQYAALEDRSQFAKYILDTTPEPRAFSVTMPERKYVHFPNPAPGNNPVAVGHEYSVLTQITGDQQWLLPLDVKRVECHEKGNEVGVKQLLEISQNAGEYCGVLGIGDSLYGSMKCRELASCQDASLTYLFRCKMNRTLYRQAEENKDVKRGRKTCYGEAVKLPVLTNPDSLDELTMHSSSGELLHVKLECWDDLLLRGTRQFKSYNHPLRVIKATVLGENGKTKFAKPLCLAVQGSQRLQLSLIEIYQSYRSRYDIEHFFRFGKQRLLFNKFQTTNLQHADNWHRLCMIAYFQLYLARKLVDVTPPAWMKYLKAYKNRQPGQSANPSMTQYGMPKLLSQIGSVAPAPKARGKSPGRASGSKQTKRLKYPVVSKGTSPILPSFNGIIRQFQNQKSFSNSQIIPTLGSWLTRGIQNSSLSLDELKNTLNSLP